MSSLLLPLSVRGGKDSAEIAHTYARTSKQITKTSR